MTNPFIPKKVERVFFVRRRKLFSSPDRSGILFFRLKSEKKIERRAGLTFEHRENLVAPKSKYFF